MMVHKLERIRIHLTLRSQAGFEVLAFGWKGSITQLCSCEEQLEDINKLSNHGGLLCCLHSFLSVAEFRRIDADISTR